MSGNIMTAARRWLYRRTVNVKARQMPALHEVQSEDLFFVPPTIDLDYQPTFGFAGYLNQQHAAWATWPLNAERILQHRIFGWLRRADALKLYEMAALCDGDILELGTHQGLSTHIMAAAVEAFGGGRRIESFDLDPNCVARAGENLSVEIARGIVSVEVGEAAAECRRLISDGRRYGFVFVDHSHYYGPMCEICDLLPAIVRPGGFVMFHDFTDPRSAAPAEGQSEPDFGVLAACSDRLSLRTFQYLGAYGCSGLFRRVGASWSSTSAAIRKGSETPMHSRLRQ
jgi:hypothetical protein